jgi:hypothetical protein
MTDAWDEEKITLTRNQVTMLGDRIEYWDEDDPNAGFVHEADCRDCNDYGCDGRPFQLKGGEVDMTKIDVGFTDQVNTTDEHVQSLHGKYRKRLGGN